MCMCARARSLCSKVTSQFSHSHSGSSVWNSGVQQTPHTRTHTHTIDLVHHTVTVMDGHSPASIFTHEHSVGFPSSLLLFTSVVTYRKPLYHIIKLCWAGVLIVSVSAAGFSWLILIQNPSFPAYKATVTQSTTWENILLYKAVPEESFFYNHTKICQNRVHWSTVAASNGTWVCSAQESISLCFSSVTNTQEKRSIATLLTHTQMPSHWSADH